MTDDAQAVAAVQGGDRDAFRSLVERHSRIVFRVAFRVTRDETDAEEVVQETFMRAYRRIGEFESRSNFSTWVYRIAVNCALDLIAKRRHQQEKAVPIVDDEGNDIALPSPGADPERLALSAELRSRIGDAMTNLTPVERTAFILRHFEGRSIEEIGAALNLRAGAAKNSIFRAVQKLRRELEPMMRPAV